MRQKSAGRNVTQSPVRKKLKLLVCPQLPDVGGWPLSRCPKNHTGGTLGVVFGASGQRPPAHIGKLGTDEKFQLLPDRRLGNVPSRRFLSHPSWAICLWSYHAKPIAHHLLDAVHLFVGDVGHVAECVAKM